MSEDFVARSRRSQSGQLGPRIRAAPKPVDPGVRITYGARELSPQEAAAVKLVAQGLTNSEIAAELHIADVTARRVVERARLATGARDRAALIIWAYENKFAVPAYLRDQQ